MILELGKPAFRFQTSVSGGRDSSSCYIITENSEGAPGLLPCIVCREPGSIGTGPVLKPLTRGPPCASSGHLLRVSLLFGVCANGFSVLARSPLCHPPPSLLPHCPPSAPSLGERGPGVAQDGPENGLRLGGGWIQRETNLLSTFLARFPLPDCLDEIVGAQSSGKGRG